MLCENLSLGVVSDDFDVDEASKVKLFCPEHRHLGKSCRRSCAEGGPRGELVVESVERILKSNALATVIFCGRFCQPFLDAIPPAALPTTTVYPDSYFRALKSSIIVVLENIEKIYKEKRDESSSHVCRTTMLALERQLCFADPNKSFFIS